MSLFTQAKGLFAQKANARDFVALDCNIVARARLKEYVLKRPFQLLLFTGSPGVGKTYVAEKLTEELSQSTIYFQKLPFAPNELVPFLLRLHAHFLPAIEPPKELTKDALMISFKRNLKHPPVIIIDEVQLYKDEVLEEIRLLSDTRVFRFVFIIHKLDKQNLLTQSYFLSRIWGTLELPPLTRQDVAVFITRKLYQNGLLPLEKWITKKHYNLLYKLSQGNLRLLTKLCYVTFELCEHYEKHSPQMIAEGTIPLRYIEMAALDVGLVSE